MSKLIIFHIFSKGSLLIDDDKSINYGPPTNKKRDRRTELAYEPVISLSNKKPRDLSYGSLLSCSLFSFAISSFLEGDSFWHQLHEDL